MKWHDEATGERQRARSWLRRARQRERTANGERLHRRSGFRVDDDADVDLAGRAARPLLYRPPSKALDEALVRHQPVPAARRRSAA